MTDVVIVDSGGANIASVRAAFRRLGIVAELSADPERIRRADRVLLPGVGAAAPAMARLRQLGLVEVLRGLTQPLLGICLGMQLLYDASWEGGQRVECLGLIPGDVRPLTPAEGIRIPHMGWNVLAFHVERSGGLSTRPAASLKERGDDERSLSERAARVEASEPRAYFVHSYAAPVTADTVATCRHGDTFTALVQRGNVMGAQFHPERSSATGAAILRAFVDEGTLR